MAIRPKAKKIQEKIELTPDVIAQIGTILSKLRDEKAEMSQSAVASKMNTFRTHVSQIENNRKLPNLHNLHNYLSALSGKKFKARLILTIDRTVA